MRNNFLQSPERQRLQGGAREAGEGDGNNHSSSNNAAGSSVLPASPARPRAKFDLLPILTNTGESVFEVGLNVPASVPPDSGPEHVLPVFRLPTVTSTAEYVNRIPREDTIEEKLFRRREEEEFSVMKRVLGLSTQEIVELEQLLGE
jgi:hypothetical protein